MTSRERARVEVGMIGESETSAHRALAEPARAARARRARSSRAPRPRIHRSRSSSASSSRSRARRRSSLRRRGATAASRRARVDRTRGGEVALAVQGTTQSGQPRPTRSTSTSRPSSATWSPRSRAAAPSRPSTRACSAPTQGLRQALHARAQTPMKRRCAKLRSSARAGPCPRRARCRTRRA